MTTSHCDPRLLTRFTNRALVIGSSAALTLGLGMTGFVPAAFATETPTPEVPSQESPAAPTPVTDPVPSDADAQNQPVTDPATNDPAASLSLATPVKAPPAPANPAVPAAPSGSAITTADKVEDVDDGSIYELSSAYDYAGIYGDALVKRTADEEYDTQHDEIFKVNPGDTLDIKSNLDVSQIVKPMDEIEKRGVDAFRGKPRVPKNATTGKNLSYETASCDLRTIISVPEYLEMPTDPEAYKLETHNGDKPPLYRITSVVRSAKRLAINLALNEFYEKGDNERGSFWRLKDGFAAYANKPLSLVISGVKVKDNIPPKGAQAQLTFRTHGILAVDRFRSGDARENRYFGNFTGLYRYLYDEQYDGDGTTGSDGTDSTFPPKDPENPSITDWIISLTMDVRPKPTPAEPENPNPNQPVTPDTPSVVPGPIPGGAVVPPSDPEPPVAGVTTPADPEPPVAGVVTTPTEPQPPVAGVVATPTEPQPPVAGVFTPAAPRIPVTQVPEKALAATGSSAETLAGGAMIVFLAGGAMMVVSRRRARR